MPPQEDVHYLLCATPQGNGSQGPDYSHSCIISEISYFLSDSGLHQVTSSAYTIYFERRDWKLAVFWTQSAI